MITCVDLFCGAGIGAAGISKHARIELAVDSDENCAWSYRYNINATRVYQRDILSPDVVLEVKRLASGCDVVFASPECQGNSNASSATLAERSSDERNWAYPKTAKTYAMALRPRVIVLENVPAIMNKPWFAAAIEGLKEVGYQVQDWLLDAADFGTPQHRKRVFLVAVRRGIRFPDQPRATHGPETKQSYKTLEDTIGKWSTTRAGRLGQRDYPEEWSYLFRPIPPGQNWRWLESNDRKRFVRLLQIITPSWKTDKNKLKEDVAYRLDPRSPCRYSILAAGPRMRGNLYCHPYQARPLWPNEFLAIQGVHNTGTCGFALAGSVTSKYRQAGNGIPPQLTENILLSILEVIK